MKNVQDFLRLFFVVGGLLLCAALYWWIRRHDFVTHARTLSGTVVELVKYNDDDNTTMYKPVVRFTTPEGSEGTLTGLGSHPAAYEVGESVNLLQDVRHPEDARLGDLQHTWMGPAALTVLGALFVALASGFMFASGMGEGKKRYLMANGSAIQTEVRGVERNERLEVNGLKPWRITSQWLDPASGKVRTFHSENLWFDPQKFLNVKQVTVLLDPKNPKRYLMDISFLPEQSSSG